MICLRFFKEMGSYGGPRSAWLRGFKFSLSEHYNDVCVQTCGGFDRYICALRFEYRAISSNAEQLCWPRPATRHRRKFETGSTPGPSVWPAVCLKARRSISRQKWHGS